MTKTARRKPAYRKWWFWLLVLGLGYLVAGFGLVPLYLSSAIPDRLQQHLGWSAEVEDVDFNPFTFTLSLGELTARDDDGEHVFDVDRLRLNVGLAELLRGTLHVERLVLDNPFLRLDVMPDQELNLVEDWRSHNPDDSGDDNMPGDILLGEGVVNGGRLQVRRMPAGGNGEPRVASIEALGLTVTDVASHERDGAGGTYKLQAVMGEQVLESSGSLNLVPLWSNGQLSLNNLGADTVQSWVGSHLPWSVQGGRLSVDTAYQFAYDDQGVALATRQGQVSARRLELADPEQPDETLASAGTLELQSVAFNLEGPELVISRVAGEELQLDAELSAEGELNLMRPLRTGRDRNAEPDNTTGLRWSVGNVTVSRSTIHWQDRRPANPVALTLEEVELNLGAMTEQLEEAISYQARATLARGGSASANGQFTLHPLTFEGGVNLDQLALTPFNGYLQQASELQIEDGTVNLSGNIDIDVQDDPLTGTFSGRGSISHFSGRLPESDDPVIAWRELRLDPIEYNFAPARLELGTVTLSEPELGVIQYPDKPLNLTRLLTPAEASGEGDRTESAGEETEANGPGLIFRLRQLDLANGEIRYTDRNPRPAFTSRLHDLEASISGLSNITPQRSRFRLNGVVAESGEFEASGTLATLGTDGESELEARLDGLSMPVLNPYFGFYLGYHVDSGKLSGTGNYKFQGTEIEATNELVLDRVELGEQIQSDSDITDPVRLGLALLRDGDNRLTLEVPVSGDLANPEFSLGPVMMRALRSALVKAALSPFNLLESIVDLGDYSPDQLGKVAFTPGETTLAMGEYTKMETVARALAAREQVVLAIRGTALESVDLPALEAGLEEDEALPDDALASLASQRGTTLKRLLMEEYNVPEEQIFLRSPEVKPGEGEDDRVSIEFELEAR